MSGHIVVVTLKIVAVVPNSQVNQHYPHLREKNLISKACSTCSVAAHLHVPSSWLVSAEEVEL